MYNQHIELRLTHKFRDGWAKMDNWKDLGYIVLTPRKVVEEGNGFDEGKTYVQFCRIPAGVNVKELMKGIRDSLGSLSRCRHEYDCCGCASYYVTVKRYGRRQLRIKTSVGYNY